ncbi:MAG: hypothetical protein E7Z73_00670 [Methanobrevibacter millerae]|uniref:Uncharacterized protein n=1 Tax=Methanobrevibacter millerae TaxID=230361 RepID=A0A8T3VJB6_9EURY|nr:hypothetical protein [Methanobrevibacter millerae]MBE6504244.1 hypothetical protein [Methanobrevibacter millerae]
MCEEKITYADVEEYQGLFTLAPSFLLETFAKRNTNLVLMFKSIIKSYMDSLTEIQKEKLNIILSTDIDELQSIMNEAYQRTKIKQYKVLANPDYRSFIKDNLDEIKALL